MTPRLLVTFLATMALAALSQAATNLHSALTPKELALGYRATVILAKPKSSQRAIVDQAEAAEHLQVRQKFARLGDLRVIQLDATDSVDRAIARLEATGRYEFVERDYVMHTDASVPNDPGFSSQWALNNTGQSAGYVVGADIKATIAWDTIHDAPNVIVAVVDGGVRADHVDLAPNLWVNPAPTVGDIHGGSFIGGTLTSDIGDENGHGTHVAGIICATGNNNAATTGVVWKTQLMVLKNAGADGYSVSSDSAAAINYAIAHGAAIINCSFGGSAYSKTLFTAMKAARDMGVVVVCAAGNDGVDTDNSPHYPGNYLLDNLVTVGNSTGADTPSSSSNYGNLVDIFAPGTSILSLDYKTTNGTALMSGTSMATPCVTGALVLLKALYPTDTYRDLINRLLSGADLRSVLGGRAATNGRLNLQNALWYGNRPFNNKASSPSVITGSQISIRSSNKWSNQVDELRATDPVHVGGNAAGSLWWWWVAPATGTYVIDTSGSAYDTALDVYTGTLPTGVAPSSTLTPFVANDDDGTNKTSRVSFTAAAGDNLFICVTGPHGSFGYTQLNIALAPANDNFAAAAALSGNSAQATADNHVATLEPGEPAILGANGGASLWYKWTATHDGRFQISAFTYYFDALLAVYTGNALDKLTLVAADDDTDPGSGLANTDSRCTINATAGTTYYIQVESKSATARGAVTTTVTDSSWQLSSDGGVFTGSPTIGTDGTVYIGAAYPDNHFYAVDPNGALRWAYTASGSMGTCTAAIGGDGTIYEGLDDGTVLALKSDGTFRWKINLGADNGISGGIALSREGTLYLHAWDGYLYALNPSDGSIKWKFNAGTTDTFGGAAIGADGTIYQGSDGNKCLYAFNPDGTLKWQYVTNATTYSTPAIDAAGNVYFATYSNSTVLSVTPAGTLRWNYVASTTASAVSSSPVLSADGNSLYIGSADGRLHAVSTSTGTQLWTYLCGKSIYACTPAVDANGVIYVGAYDGKLYAVTSSGVLQRTWDTAGIIRSSPVISGTRLYVGSNDAKLYAFDIGTTAATGPWSQYFHDARRRGRVTDALAIITAPAAQTVTMGAALTLTVSAVGQDPLTYQWKNDGTTIPGATSGTYTVAKAATADAGAYTVTIVGPQGSVTSTAVTVSVVPATPVDPGRLTNLSIRSQAGTGSQTLIVGFTLRAGTDGSDKPLLIRGVGPTLAGYGVTTAIADPVLTVYHDSTVVQSNDGWANNAQITAVGNQFGAFPLLANSLDAALYTQLPATSYTVWLTGKTAGTGVGLVEVYDATPSDTYSAAKPRLVNVSARTQVGTAGDVLILGFAVGGTTAEHLLIRGIGPKLTTWGVTGVLENPMIELHSDQGKIDENDDWDGKSSTTAAFDSVGAFELDPGSKDAVLTASLKPGSYTVVLKGVGDTTGVALVEMYELP